MAAAAICKVVGTVTAEGTAAVVALKAVVRSAVVFLGGDVGNLGALPGTAADRVALGARDALVGSVVGMAENGAEDVS